MPAPAASSAGSSPRSALSLGLNIEPSSPAAYLLGLAIILGAIFALACANEIRAVADQGEGALLSTLERWEPDMRQTVARALAQVG